MSRSAVSRVSSAWPTLVILALSVLATDLQAQEAQTAERGVPASVVSEKRPYRLDYDHVSRTLTVTNHHGQMVSEWDDQHEDSVVQPVIAVPAERPVVVTIRNGNPLLYNYGVQFQHLQAVADKSCSTISRRFSTQFAFGSLLPFTADSQEYEDDSAETVPVNFLDQIAELFGRREGELSGSAINGEVDDLRRVMPATLNEFNEGVEELNAEVQRLRQAVPSLAWSAESEALAGLVAGLLQSVRTNLDIGADTPANAPAMVRQLQRARRSQVEDSLIPRVLELEAAIAKTPGVGENAAGLLTDWVREIGASSDSWQTALGGLFQEIDAMQRLAAQSTQVFLIPAARSDGAGRSQAISINVVPDSSHVPLSGAPRYKAGRVLMYTRPGSALYCSISLGAVFASASPDYEIDEAGTLIDRNEFGDNASTEAAAFIHIVPSRLPALGLSLGLGTGGRLPDLYLGGTLGALRPVFITAGYAWRWQHSLPNGIRVGDLVADQEIAARILASRLKRKYVSGLFLGISLGL